MADKSCYCWDCSHLMEPTTDQKCEFCGSNKWGISYMATTRDYKPKPFRCAPSRPMNAYEQPTVLQQIGYRMGYRLAKGFALIAKIGDRKVEW
jgi:hypothetical protein